MRPGIVLLAALWNVMRWPTCVLDATRKPPGPPSPISRTLGSTSSASTDICKLFQVVTLWERLLWGGQSHFNTHNTAMGFQCGASNKFQSFLQSALASLREGTLSQSLKEDEPLVEARRDWGFRAYGCKCLDVSAHTRSQSQRIKHVCTVIRYTIYWQVSNYCTLTVSFRDRVPPIGSWHKESSSYLIGLVWRIRSLQFWLFSFSGWVQVI